MKELKLKNEDLRYDIEKHTVVFTIKPEKVEEKKKVKRFAFLDEEGVEVNDKGIE